MDVTIRSILDDIDRLDHSMKTCKRFVDADDNNHLLVMMIKFALYMMIIVVVLMVDDDDDDDDDDDHLVDADDVPRELRRWSLVRRIHWRSGNRRNLQSVVDYDFVRIVILNGWTLKHDDFMAEAEKREIGKILIRGANF